MSSRGRPCCELAAWSSRSTKAKHQRRVWPIEGAALFLTYLFRKFPLRKIYCEIPGHNYARLQGSLTRLFAVEGQLRDHEWHSGRYWDTYIVAITRTTWAQDIYPLLAPRMSRS